MKFSKGVLAVIGGCLMHFILGTLYIWGNINIYITSYYRLKGYDINIEFGGWIFPLWTLCQSIGMHLSTKAGDAIGYK